MFRISKAVLVAALALTFAVTSVGCEEPDPLTKAQKLLDEGKTDEAKPILEGLHQSDPKAYDPIYLLGEIAAEKKDYAGMVGYYEKALELPEGKRLKKLLTGKLHEGLMGLANSQSTFPDKYEATLLRAAKVEEDLRMAQTPANEALFKMLSAKYDTAKTAGRFADAIATAKKIGDLYYDRDELKPYKKAIARLEKDQFKAEVEKAFDDKVKGELVKAGFWDEATRSIKIRFEFTIPEKTEEGLFDIASESFEQEARFVACEKVKQQLGTALNIWTKASPVARELEKPHVNAFFNRAMEGQTPAWKEAYDPAKPPKSGAGLVYICEASLPTAYFVKHLPAIKRQFEKAAAEKKDGEKKDGEKKDGEKKDEKPAAEKKDGEKSAEEKPAPGAEAAKKAEAKKAE